MGGILKILKGIFFFLMGLILAGCAGVMVCAFNPSLAAELAARVESVIAARGADSSGDPGAERPGVNVSWLEGQTGYEVPESRPAEAPEAVRGMMGYEPVQEEPRQIDQQEADALPADTGETGSDLTFDGEMYPYYAMLEPAMQEIYRQIYANALERNVSFAPVAEVSMSQIKTVFEAVYNDHPELFWLETGYSCKYLRDGRCVEVTLKYNSTADALEEAKAAFEAAAGNIISQAQGLGSQQEKEKYVHDALVQLAEYDLAAPMNQSAYSALVGGRSVCAGYARALQYIMQQLGIPCYYCTGYAGQNHAWNIVKLDGVYYNVDVTWGDTEEPTYDYYNKSDKEYAPTHVRTGLSVYLPACVTDGAPVAEESTEKDGISDFINPNPIKPMTWESKVRVDPVETLPPSSEEDAGQQDALQEAGITADQVRDTLPAYYEDCGKLLREAGVGDKQFVNVVPQSLWEALERAYTSGEFWQGYVEPALKDMGAENFAIHLQIQDIGGGYYRIYHNVYTY